MSISSLVQVYSNLTNSLTNPSNTFSTTNIGNNLLSSIGTSSSVVQQDKVSLSSLSSIQNNPLPQTYNAQGLLQQIQTNLLQNDQLLLSGSTSTSGGSISDSLLQGLLSTSQSSALPSVGSQSPSNYSSTNSINTNANWLTVLKQNSSMATVLVQSQIDQSLLSIFS